MEERDGRQRSPREQGPQINSHPDRRACIPPGCAPEFESPHLGQREQVTDLILCSEVVIEASHLTAGLQTATIYSTTRTGLTLHASTPTTVLLPGRATRRVPICCHRAVGAVNCEAAPMLGSPGKSNASVMESQVVIAAAVLVGTLGVMALASASTDNTKVLHLRDTIIQQKNLDLGDPGLASVTSSSTAAICTAAAKRSGPTVWSVPPPASLVTTPRVSARSPCACRGADHHAGAPADRSAQRLRHHRRYRAYRDAGGYLAK